MEHTHSGPFHQALREFAFERGALRDLGSLDCRATPAFETLDGRAQEKQTGTDRIAQDVERLAELQNLLFANAEAAGLRRSVLLIVQGMDTSGKGGVTKHVVGAMNPQGCTRLGSRNQRPKNSNTISSGASDTTHPNTVKSRCSTARITRMCWCIASRALLRRLVCSVGTWPSGSLNKIW